MTTEQRPLTVAIDTTADIAGIAVFNGSDLVSELTWYSRQSHSRDLLPSLDWLLERANRRKAEIGAVVVCTGPGSYAGMRVGVSTAKALAFGLGASLAGIDRLAADALNFAGATASSGRIIAVHAAGRAELAWAAYTADGKGGIEEATAPSLSPIAELPSKVNDNDLVVGEIATLPPAFVEAMTARGISLAASHPSRVVSVGRLGLKRLAAGHRDDPNSLAPLYLRAPAIGPQPPVS
jgi:tRNA threonylcarbamoyladenosine biosynthesis protein TsaB